MVNESLLKYEERVFLRLSELYRSRGYLPFKMSKFEEYELYMKNKDFLLSDRIITFNDTNGKLMALKPDVTLSILRNTTDLPGVKQRVFYHENVYRVSEGTHRFKEIMQAGVECIGDIDLYDIFEAISLAAKSLSTISERFVLEISDLSLLSAVLEQVHPGRSFRDGAIRCISRKSPHELENLCREFGVSDEHTTLLCSFVSAYGDRKTVLADLAQRFDAPLLANMRRLDALLDTLPESDKILFDFSVVNDMSYYNGFVFKGFVDGICDGVLAGGQYGGMMKKMGRKAGAIGFAVYLDLLETLDSESEPYDVDVLLLYGADTAPQTVAAAAAALTAQSLTVSAQRAVPPGLRYGRLVELKGDALC